MRNILQRVGAGSLFAITAAPAAGQWTVTNLHPAGATGHSQARSAHAGQQVAWGGMTNSAPSSRPSAFTI